MDASDRKRAAQEKLKVQRFRVQRSGLYALLFAQIIVVIAVILVLDIKSNQNYEDDNS